MHSAFYESCQALILGNQYYSANQYKEEISITFIKKKYW